ncbi:MAG TPA: GntR family transcriptional regulator, partial [Acidimicrobiales bacterium]|nr:GntR family transcriptional regulator [Acidimicrobiales bacterium]
EELGVSRNPVRESIRALEATGLIEVIPRRGAYVTSFDVDELREVLEVRSVLEAYAAELAALRHSAADLAALDRCLDEGVAASTRGDLVTASQCHREFHLAIEAASGNRHLPTTVGPLRHRTELVFSVLAPERGLLSWEEHRRIRDAIASGDPAAARSRAVEHLTAVLDDLSRSTRG